LALNNTTANGAIGAFDNYIRVAVATGAVQKGLMKIEDEFVEIVDITRTPTLRVARGRNGTKAVAHANGTPVVIGDPGDFERIPAPSVYYHTAAGAIDPRPGLHVLLGGAANAMTLRRPTLVEEGIELTITTGDAFAYTVTNTTPGFNAGGAASDVGTYGAAIGNVLQIKAVNRVWNVVGNIGVVLA
jgi:hypothetical protein